MVRWISKLLTTTATSFLLVSTCYASDFNNVKNAIVFLQHLQIDTYVEKGTTNEIWFKNTVSGEMKAKMVGGGGTGTIISRHGAFYIATVKHVAKEMEIAGDNSVVLGGSNNRSIPVPLPLLQGTNKWIHHAVEDISILPINPPIAPMDYGCLDLDSFFGSTTNVPDRNITLTVVGFALGRGWGHNVGENFSPITRVTRAASEMLHDDQFGEFFSLEDPSVQGFSGAPVFDFDLPLISAAGIQAGGRPTGCYGIVSFTLSDDTGGKMAGVVPTQFLLELVQKWESR